MTPPPVPPLELTATGGAPPLAGISPLLLAAMAVPAPPPLAPPLPGPAPGRTCCVPAVPSGGFCPDVPALGTSSSSSSSLWPASPEQAARHTTTGPSDQNRRRY